MQSFRTYFNKNKIYKERFTKVFNEYYDIGYFGKLKKLELKEVQLKWFYRVIHIVEGKNAKSLLPMNPVTTEMVEIITGVKMKQKSNRLIKKIMEGFDV